MLQQVGSKLNDELLELQEDNAGKNLHLEHLEDEIINNGVSWW